MDQFRGFTVLSMFAVHYSSLFPQRESLATFTHNNTYLSFADTVLPSFLFASGFALRLTFLRRVAGRGAAWAYLRTVRRALLLILLLQFFMFDRWWPRVRDMYQLHGSGAAVDVLLKGSLWESLSIIGLTTLWTLPVIAASARVRVIFLLAGLVVHALATQWFYFAYLHGRPNWLDDWLQATGESDCVDCQGRKNLWDI
jgi:predicted acyltransferase